MSHFQPRKVHIFRPYADEIPWELLLAADPDETRVYGYADADYMRVAKFQDQAVGVYVVAALSDTRYQLCNLSVAPGYRRQGLGRWLLGHAIGISESKGGREILVRNTPLRGLFQRTGFTQVGDDLLLTLLPE